jgi:outer membrane receptor protein involved in Fe transport
MLRGFEDDFFPDLRQEETLDTYRLGFRHSFSLSSILLGNYQHQEGDIITDDAFPIPGVGTFVFDQDGDRSADGVELQYLFRSQYVSFVAGGGYFDVDQKDDIFIGLDIGVPGFPIIPIQDDAVDLSLEHSNGYLYSYIKPLNNVTFTIGASYDDFDAADELVLNEDQDQFNPKFGVTWNPFPATTLRGAAFRVLKRSTITDQTLEPTQVAGFNQFFDEIEGTDYWVYGGAIDQKVTDSIYGGVEYTYRDLDVPWIDAFSGPTLENKEADWEEKIFRAYLFWAPHDWLALSAEYLWERFERDDDALNQNIKTVETNSFPLGINFFHPSGLSASLKGTYVDQQGSFERLDDPRFTYSNNDDNFFLVDAAIRYRFPKRYGFFTLGVSNLTDEDFDYFDSDMDNPRFQPDRFFFGSITLAVP